eukprot:547752-Pyramimonas_sp.AAC.1
MGEALPPPVDFSNVVATTYEYMAPSTAPPPRVPMPTPSLTAARGRNMHTASDAPARGAHNK